MRDYYIGLMSGTSLDGADGVLVDFHKHKLSVLAAASEPFSSRFRAELLALNTPAHNELHRAALASNQLVTIYSKVVSTLLLSAAEQGIMLNQVKAIGAHGQTVRHQPRKTLSDPIDASYTLQLNNPALLTELTGIDVVADFRSRDVAAGGQGAPLVPAFHASVFGQTDCTVIVLNVGGISNLSILPAGGNMPTLGFDCGPGNALMDAWCLQHTGQPFDASGAWAAGGKCIPTLLASLLNEPYFSAPPPKSTGRDLFSLVWLTHKLHPYAAYPPQDIQNTLTEFTASTCVTAINVYLKNSNELIVCGGGAFNNYLMQRLQAGLPSLRVCTSDAYDLPPQQVEAAAFAWLARQAIYRKTGNVESVTGAAGARILGAIYPA